MAKSRKKTGKESEVDSDSIERDQAQVEEGNASARAEHNEESYEDGQSRPGVRRNDRNQTDVGKEGHEDEIAREAARETGHEPVSKREKEINLGAQAIREAKRKSQAPASARVTRKEPSTASARGNGKNRTAKATRSGMQGKKAAVKGQGRTAAMAGKKKVTTNKKSKSRSAR